MVNQTKTKQLSNTPLSMPPTDAYMIDFEDLKESFNQKISGLPGKGNMKMGIKNVYSKRDDKNLTEGGDIIPLSQMEALIAISYECHQSFHYDCTMAPLKYEMLDFAFWRGRDGVECLLHWKLI